MTSLFLVIIDLPRIREEHATHRVSCSRHSGILRATCSDCCDERRANFRSKRN